MRRSAPGWSWRRWLRKYWISLDRTPRRPWLANTMAMRGSRIAAVRTGSLSGGPFFGITVPAGGHCDLFTANVVGDVVALPGSAVNISIHSTIRGDVIGDGALVQVINSVVVGDLALARAPDSETGVTEVAVMDSTIVNGSIAVRDSAGTILVDRNRVINGDIAVTSNFVPPFLEYPSQLSVRLNQVDGNVTVSSNSGPGLKEVHSNTVTGTLACLENEQPFVGGPNSAGSTAGDCF